MAKISIGLPVYNGERYLPSAIESILSQSYQDFELIVCDNASTDKTAQICKDFCVQDKRIRYFRNANNMGAAANFNRSFELATGKYFKWAADDDLCAPDFLLHCFEVLENDPGAILAYPRTMVVDANGNEIGPYDYKLLTDSAHRVVRFKELLKGHKCFEVFGLIRRDALLKTHLIGAYAHGDGVLLSHLSLLGRFVEIPEYLFFARHHPDQSMAIMKKKAGSPTHEEYCQYAIWFNPNLKDKLLFPYWKICFEYFRIITTTPINFSDRISCYRCLSNWIYTIRYRLRKDIKFQVIKFLSLSR
jgi:glycosyltransferase involved in cell wall biosynthesis